MILHRLAVIFHNHRNKIVNPIDFVLKLLKKSQKSHVFRLPYYPYYAF